LADPTEEGPQEPAYDRWSRPDALSKRGYVLAVVVPVLIAAAGFGVVSLVSAGDETARGVTVRLPVSGWAPGSSGGDALIQGTVRIDADHCVYLGTEEGAQGTADKVWPVWPAGFRATREGGAVTIFDPDGHAVARSGDTVRMGGGYGPAGTFQGQPCLPDDGEVAIVQSEVTVLQPDVQPTDQ
jgi:hypothetical protein